jgi:hypothetical protein
LRDGRTEIAPKSHGDRAASTSEARIRRISGQLPRHAGLRGVCAPSARCTLTRGAGARIVFGTWHTRADATPAPTRLPMRDRAARPSTKQGQQRLTTIPDTGDGARSPA